MRPRGRRTHAHDIPATKEVAMELTDDPYLNRINHLQEAMAKQQHYLESLIDSLERKVDDLERKVRDLENDIMYSSRR